MLSRVVMRRSSEREDHVSKASVFVTREADGRANSRREIRVPKVAGARAATLSSLREYTSVRNMRHREMLEDIEIALLDTLAPASG